MPSQTLKLLVRGLYTHPNPLSEVPEGALAVASNVVIDREGQADSRRGFKQHNLALADTSKLYNYRQELLALADEELYVDNGSSWGLVPGGPVVAPFSFAKPQSASQNGSLFVTSDRGILKLDSAGGTLREAGVARGLDVDAALSGVSGFMPDASQVAYRVVFGIRDANGVLVLGAPSVRRVVTNASGGTRNVSLTFTVPESLTTSHFYQIYRSLPSVSASATPNDELQLVFEKEFSGAQIAARLVTHIDSIPQEEMGATIYTAPSQEGILAGNEQPPLAADLVEFRQHMFYFNTRLKERVIGRLVENCILGDTLTIAGLTYTAAAVENIAAGDFLVGATAEDTLDFLVRVVNRRAANTLVYAYTLNEATVDFLIEARTYEGAAFSVSASVGSRLSKPSPIASTNDAKSNRVYISKALQPEAVAPLSFIDQGSEDRAIQRGLSVRDAVFSLKEDGIYRITGFDLTSFVSEAHDNTVAINGAETAVVLDNRVFVNTNQGVVAVTLAGVDIISRAIEGELLSYGALSNFESLAWAASYESDRKFLMAVPTDDSQLAPQVVFVYNFLTRAWTTWSTVARHGLVKKENDLLYLVLDEDERLREERKTFSISDYADDEYDVTINSSTSNSVTVASVPSGVSVGMTLQQGSSEAVIVDIAGLVLTLATENLLWSSGAALVFAPISVSLMWTETDMGNPGLVKHLVEETLFFEDARFEEITLTTGSDFVSGSERAVAEAKLNGLWGLFPWGDAAWGGDVGGFQAIRAYIPRDARRGHWFRFGIELSQAFNAVALLGISVLWRGASSKFRETRSA